MYKTFLLGIMLLFTLTFPAEDRRGGLNPYLYYYSWERQAFIVQNVDNTDNYVLAEFVLPDRHTEIVGAGWSPSGQWFSWTSQRANGTGGNTVFIIDRAGQLSEVVFSTDSEIEETTWSPTEEFLLIRYRTGLNSVVIYDANQRQILIEFNGHELNDSGGEVILDVDWSHDGQYLMIHDYGSNMTRIVEVLENSIVTSFQSLGTPRGGCHESFGQLPRWLDSEHLAYISVDSARATMNIQNISTGNSISIELPDWNIHFADWSQGDDFVLLYTPTSSSMYNVWLLSLEDEVVALMNSNAMLSTYCDPPSRETVWSLSNLAYFIADNGQIYIVSAEEFDTYQIIPTVSGEILDERDIQWTPEGNLEFIWYVPDHNELQVFGYAPPLDSVTPIEYDGVSVSGNVSVISISNHGYRAYGNIVINPITNEIFPIEIQSPSDFGSLSVTDVRWHPTADWMFLVSSQINNLHWINLSNIDGTNQQQLGLCPSTSLTCYGWLPTTAVR